MNLRILTLALVALLAGFAAVAQAPPQADDDDDEPAPVNVAQEQPVVRDENFEQWVFQNQGNQAGARKQMDAMLTLQTAEIARACQLTAAQKAKLQLMGRGDTKRFFDRYEKVKQKFQLVKHDQQKMQGIWQDIQPLQMSIQVGLFQEDSILARSLHNTLTAEQLARYGTLERERRDFRHRASIELAVTVLEQGTPLRDEQRRQLITLLTSATKPPRKSGHQYDYYIMMIQIGRIPDEKLKPLFDNSQWKVVSRQVGQFKGMEHHFKKMGVLPDEEDEADKAGKQPGT